MSSSRTAVTRTHQGFELLRDLVHEQTGLFFDDDDMDLFAGKLSPLMDARAFNSLMDYYYQLKCDSASAEWGRLFDVLTVQESYFWREMEQIHALVDLIVPQFFRAHPDHTLNIWSAACAGGCEPLTIAMVLNEAGWFDRARINIDASDASPSAIEMARNGVYKEHTFRRLPPELREKYFVRSGDLSRVSADLHTRVRWRKTNLMSENDLESAPMASPVIFCRNVFIYFSDYAARKTVSAFAKTMPKDGCLFFGMAESLMKIAADFEPREIGDAFVHIRK